MPVVLGNLRRLHADVCGNPIDQKAIMIYKCVMFPDFIQQLSFFNDRGEILQIFIKNTGLRILQAFREEISSVLFRRPLSFSVPGAVFDIFARLHIHIIDIKIVFRQGIDNAFVNGACAQGLLISGLGLFILFSDADNLCEIHAHAQKAQPSCFIDELEFCRLKLFLIARRIGNIFKKSIWFFRRKCFPVIL